jgi:transposase
MRVKLSKPISQIEKGLWRPYGIGIDVHSRFAYVVVLVPEYREGNVARAEDKFPITVQGIADMRAWIQQVLKQHGIEERSPIYAIESTATYHCPVVANLGGRAIVLNPVLARAALKKTDRFDAGTLAYHSLTGLYQPTWVADGVWRELRVLTRGEERFRTIARAILSTITLRITECGIPITGLIDSVGGSRLRPILEDWAYGRQSVDRMPREVREAFSLQPIPESTRFTVRACFDALSAVEVTGAAIGNRILDAVAAIRVTTANGPRTGVQLRRVLESVPGIGPATSLCVLSEMGDPSRFPSADRFAAYCGFDPSRRVSADKVVGVSVRPGNRRLRRCFVQAANLNLNRGDGPLARWAQNLLERKKRGIVIVALARRLARVAYATARTGRQYREDLATGQGDPTRVGLAEVFPKRISNILLKGGWLWLDELIERPGWQKLPGMGIATVQLVRKWLTDYGFETSFLDDGRDT